MALKEKAKKYIQSTYPNCSIHEVAVKFGIPDSEVEAYFLEELVPPTTLKEKEDYLAAHQPPAEKKAFFTGQKVLIALLFLVLVILVWAMNISQISNNDIWMHLKNGELILKNRHFLYTDTYSFRTIGMPWVNHEWLAGVIFYLVFQMGKVNGLIIFKTLLVLVLTLWLIATCLLTKNRWNILYPVIVFALFNAGVRSLERPHMFTDFFVPVFFFILFAYKYRKKDYLFWLPILMLLWVNIHGGFVVGMGIITLFTLFETCRTFLNRYLKKRQNDILSIKQLKKLWIIWLISGLVLMLNPHGLSIYTYPFELASKQTFMTQIYEWQPPFKSETFMKSYAFNYFLVWMALLGLSFLLDWKRFDLTNFMLSLLFLSMALKMHRNITIFALATAPIISLNLDQFFDGLFKDQKGFIGADLLVKTCLLLITAGLTVMSFQYGYIYRQGSNKPYGWGVASNMPIKAVEYLKKNQIKGNSFNPYTYGTYLIWHLYPETRVVMDSRDLPYGESLYLEHQYAMVDVNAFKFIFQKYHIDYILLNYRQSELVEHFKYLQDNKEWVMVYFDDQNLIYIRNTPTNKGLIDRDGYLALHPVLTFRKGGLTTADIPRYLKECQRSIERNPELVFPRLVLQSIYLAIDEYEKAAEQGEKIVQIGPPNVRTHLLLGENYLKMRKWDKAIDQVIKIQALEPANPFSYLLLGDINKAKGDYEKARLNYLKALELKSDLGATIQPKLQELHQPEPNRNPKENKLPSDQ